MGGWTSSDWYSPIEGQLHFFQGAKHLLWVLGRQIVVDVEAWGGESAVPHVHYDTMAPRVTTAGAYIVESYAPYLTKTWQWSRLPWGTPLRVDGENQQLFFREVTGGAWRKLAEVIPEITLGDVRDRFVALYGDGEGPDARWRYDRDGDGIPDQWIFNDFGPYALRYFVDRNRNRRFDAGERMMGEMIHTTPEDEARALRGVSFSLQHSHGCIHVRPADRERMVRAGAFRRGTLLVVHGVREAIPGFLKP
ncbi:MAG TPA: hypothetical protein VGP07_21420 [Polyangia bacterium]|jgi:hypothetical protein